MRYIVIHHATSDSQSCLDGIVSSILKYRSDKQLPDHVEDEKKTYDNGGADIFLDHLPINVHYRSSSYES